MDTIVGIAPFPVKVERARPKGVVRPAGDTIGELGITVRIAADHVVRRTPGRPFGLALDDRYQAPSERVVSVTGLYEALIEKLLGELPSTLRGGVHESLRRLRGGERSWRFADALSTVGFLLTAKVNGNDGEALGASLYEVGLVPAWVGECRAPMPGGPPPPSWGWWSAPRPGCG